MMSLGKKMTVSRIRIMGKRKMMQILTMKFFFSPPMLGSGMFNLLITLAILEQGRRGKSESQWQAGGRKREQQCIQGRGARFNGAWLPRMFILCRLKRIK